MLLVKTLEYLFYLALFAFMCKYGQAANVPTTEPSPVQVETLKQPQKMDPSMNECEISPFSWMCLKIEIVKIMEKLAEQQELNVLPGVSVVKDENATELKTSELMAEVARSYPSDPNTRLNGYILAKMENLLKTRYLRFRLLDDKSLVEGRKHKFGKKGGLEALLAAGVMMKGMLMAMGFGAIALMAGKALMTALMALTLSGVLGLKSLASGGGKSTTYEIVAKPIYTSSHSHSVSHEDGHAHSAHFGAGGGGGSASGYGYGGYARSLNLQQPSQMQKL
ncbi:uncharacterized protein Dwil_GK13048 [Drosophila willistoni]|uniref:Osiris 16 n=1 Tax=Drosophila willistoni TaxID=7260 RepID=B4NHC2_DROWI|nr:uncharacterized protein LOC6650042 [Drosophila willistoni]EDW84598.1 uncharacterized protein Dwil_GK13048 [Drosophila willistoni]